MDPTIAAALISGGVGALGIVGTVVTSVVGSKDTREATEQTVRAGADANRATLIAAREDRLWEKRAAAYEEMLARLMYRQANRQALLVRSPGDGETLRDLWESYSSHELPETFEIEGRLVAYASDAVTRAYLMTKTTHATFNAFADLEVRRADAVEGMSAAAQILNVQMGVVTDVIAADVSDQKLIDIIRDELRSRPEAALQPVTALPAVRRRFWLGNRGLHR